MQPKSTLLQLLLVATLSIFSITSISLKQAYANGFVELSGGLSQPIGSALEPSLGGGAQLLIGGGGRPSWASKGSAVYPYLAGSYERLSQRGDQALGEPLINREHLTLHLGARVYWLIATKTRMWVDLAASQVFENATLGVEGLEPLELNATALSMTGGVGLQYKLQPRLLLSLGYHIPRLGAQPRFALIERPARVAEGDALWAKGRLSLGIGVTF